MGIQVIRTKSEPLPAGAYTATIEAIEQAEGQYGPQLKARFLIEDDEFAGKTLTGWASLTFSPKSKLFSWVKAAVFNGREVPDTYGTFDTDHLLGRRVILNVEQAKGSDGAIYNKIGALLPYRTAKAQPTTAPRPAPAPAPAQEAQPPAATTRAASVAPAEPDWPGWDETILTDPDYGAED